jgi:tRNA threonylcarbamoyladenosine biosynthesis protein TsaB
LGAGSSAAAAEPRPARTVVGFDTATDDTAVAALRDGEPLHESRLAAGSEGRPLHATALLPAVEAAAAAAGGWDAIDAIAVGIGPGSFTGLRIGIATARGLRTASAIPVVGVGTLDALARGIGALAPDRPRLPILDARRGEVFAALYSASGARLVDPLVCPPGELAGRLGAEAEPALAAGSGALRFRDELAAGGAEVPEDSDPVHRVSALHTCALGAAIEAPPADPLEPIYLRPPDAERWRERDTAERKGG